MSGRLSFLTTDMSLLSIEAGCTSLLRCIQGERVNVVVRRDPERKYLQIHEYSSKSLTTIFGVERVVKVVIVSLIFFTNLVLQNL